jgi:hypothetical protein
MSTFWKSYSENLEWVLNFVCFSQESLSFSYYLENVSRFKKFSKSWNFTINYFPFVSIIFLTEHYSSSFPVVCILITFGRFKHEHAMMPQL